MEPASSKIGQLTKTVGEKFETSDNSVVRGIRGNIYFIQISVTI